MQGVDHNIDICSIRNRKQYLSFAFAYQINYKMIFLTWAQEDEFDNWVLLRMNYRYVFGI